MTLFNKNCKIIKLSYDLDIKGPFAPGSDPLTIKQIIDTKKGDIATAYRISVTNHSQTHADAPRHLVDDGLTITDFNMTDFVFNNPLIIDMDLKDDDMIGRDDLIRYSEKIKTCDILLVRTGYSKFRSTNTNRYIEHGPGFSIDGAKFLGTFPNLRAVGMDTISFAAIAHLDEGMEAHKVFFTQPGKHHFILEDITLDYDLNNLRGIIMIPWMIVGIDSAPCTLLAIKDA